MRKLKSWIDSFVEYSSSGTSPEIFRKWGAIAIIAGALERRVWVQTMGSPMYPHLYILLVAPPGIGKTYITAKIYEMWRALPDQKIAANSVNFASIVDELREAQRNLIIPGEPPIQYHSLKVVSNDLQVLLPEYDSNILGKLTDIYDALPYSERRRNETNSFNIERPQINLIAATQPKYMSSTLPDSVWELGFMSRVIMIYHGKQEKRSLFAARHTDKDAEAKLKSELNVIAKLHGEYIFTDEAASLLDAWWMADGPPAPDHPRFANYCTRRHAHVIKLMMVSAADRGNDLVLDERDFERALEWLLEAEMLMPEIFKAMAASGDGRVVEDLWHAMFKQYIRNGNKPFPQSVVFNHLRKRLPAYSIEKAVEGMVTSGLLKVVTVPGQGKCYEPLPPKAESF